MLQNNGAHFQKTKFIALRNRTTFNHESLFSETYALKVVSQKYSLLNTLIFQTNAFSVPPMKRILLVLVKK